MTARVIINGVVTTVEREDMVAVSGNTYPVKDKIKTLGGRWDADRKAWMVPASNAEAARALVPAYKPAPNHTHAAAFSQAGHDAHGPGTYECEDCGDRVRRGTTCWETGLAH